MLRVSPAILKSTPRGTWTPNWQQAYPLLVVGDDAANKVGVRVPQGSHELGEGLLVELSHCAEHSLLCLVSGSECRLCHTGHLVQAHDAVHWWEKDRS